MNGKRQALGRQQARVDADVDEGLQTEHEPEAMGHVAGKAFTLGAGAAPMLKARQVRNANSPMTSRTPSRPNSSPTTASRKVGVRLRQIELLLNAVAETNPEPFATPERDQRLAELIAGVERVGEGVQERGDALSR
jgi:hypothetical protein